MLETLSVRPRICDQIRSGPLGRWVDDFVDVLMTRGYATGTVRRYVRAAAIFSAWLAQQRVAATDVDETLVTRFVTGLSRRPSSTRPSGRLSDVAYGVRLLAAHLWTRGVAARPVPVAALCESEQWLQRFDEHLVQAHGLVVGTRRRVPALRRSLSCRVRGDADARLVPPHRADDRGFRAGPVKRALSVLPPQPGHGHPCVFFASWPPTAWFRPASREPCRPSASGSTPDCPRALADDDVQRVLAAVDETRPNGCRDRAILLLLSRLGLRAAEAAALTVKDVDWHNGVVRVAGKGGKERRLPLPADIGAALVATLRSRPLASPPDVIFVTALPPYRQLGGSAVTAIATRALLRRAGVIVPRPGAHLFRHAFASQMVRRDVPMKTVADLLGHARLETTTIYAKLDRETLATIALPWPGGER